MRRNAEAPAGSTHILKIVTSAAIDTSQETTFIETL